MAWSCRSSSMARLIRLAMMVPPLFRRQCASVQRRGEWVTFCPMPSRNDCSFATHHGMIHASTRPEGFPSDPTGRHDVKRNDARRCNDGTISNEDRHDRNGDDTMKSSRMTTYIVIAM